MIKQTPAYLTPGGKLCSSQQEAEIAMEKEVLCIFRKQLEAYVLPEDLDEVAQTILSELLKGSYLS